MLFPKNIILELETKIKEAKTITLISHFNPDGDTIGAVAAMFYYLKLRNKNLKILIPNEFPQFLNFIMQALPYIIGTKDIDKTKRLLNETDLIICLDFNSISRVGDMFKDSLSQTPAYKILIDHHREPEKDNFNLILSTINTSSTCELLYEILLLLEDGKTFLTKDIAKGLYIGICTDTGSFSFSCQERRTYEIVAELVENGADVEYIHQEIYNTYSENRLRLLGFCLCERLKVFHHKGAAFIYLSKEDLRRFNYQIGDCEGVVNYTLSLQGIEFGALLTERADRIRISFRSKYGFDVNEFARRYWNGGGHKKAAGGHSFESLDAVIEKLSLQIQEMDIKSK